MKNKKTIKTIIRDRFFRWLERSSSKTIAFSIFEAFLIIGGCFVVIFPKIAISAIYAAFSAGDFAAIKVIFLILIIKNRSKLAFFAQKLKSNKKKRTIEGVPTDELLHFLFDENGFPVERFQKRFGLNWKIHGKIAKRLERLGVLERGEKNARKLSAKFSLEEICDMLERAKSAADISFFRVNRLGDSGPRTREKIAREIKETNEREKEFCRIKKF